MPPVGNGRIRSLGVATSHSLDEGSNVVKRVRLTRKTHVGVSSVCIPDQGHSTPSPPSSVGVGGETGVSRNLFPRIGVG